MRNTGTILASKDCALQTLPELKELLPPLTDEQLSCLEADLLENGCYSPIIVNEDMIIVDGHNRYELCEKHGIPYRVTVFHFDDLLEAKEWAISAQKARRNLTVNELCKIAMKLRPEIEARAKVNLSSAGGDKLHSNEAPLTTLSKAVEAVNTRKELADSVGVGEVTMGKAIQIEDHAPQPVKDAVDSGELSVHQGYNITRQLKDLPEDEREEAAKKAIEYEKAKSELRRSNARIDEEGRIAKLFCTGFEKAVLLDPQPENVRIWVEYARMTPDEMLDAAKEAREIADAFERIAEIVETEILPKDWRGAERALPVADEASAAPTEREQKQSGELFLPQRSEV